MLVFSCSRLIWPSWAACWLKHPSRGRASRGGEGEGCDGLAVVDVVVAVLAHVHVSVSVCTCCPTFLVAVLASARSQRAIQD